MIRLSQILECVELSPKSGLVTDLIIAHSRSLEAVVDLTKLGELMRHRYRRSSLIGVPRQVNTCPCTENERDGRYEEKS